MKIYELQRSQTVAEAPERVFDFFKKPENLAALTPPSLGFRILTPQPVKMAQGVLIDYTIQLFGIPQRWTSMITVYDPPRLFVDEQVKGPYSFWHHEHRFESFLTGARIIDHVRYAVAFSPIGEIAHFFIVRKNLETIFDYRARAIQQMFGQSEL